MCVKMRGDKIVPGAVVRVTQKSGDSVSIWGFNNGDQYNARSERLHTLYVSFTRGIVKMNSFWEGLGEFVPVQAKEFSIGVIVNKNNEFAVLTRNANKLIKQYHHRMPVLFTLEGEDKFLNAEFSDKLWLPEYLVALKQKQVA